jgi:hypothetical protein
VPLGRGEKKTTPPPEARKICVSGNGKRFSIRNKAPAGAVYHANSLNSFQLRDWQRSGDLRNETISFVVSGITGKRLRRGAQQAPYRRARRRRGLGLRPAADLSRISSPRQAPENIVSEDFVKLARVLYSLISTRAGASPRTYRQATGCGKFVFLVLPSADIRHELLGLIHGGGPCKKKKKKGCGYFRPLYGHQLSSLHAHQLEAAIS